MFVNFNIQQTKNKYEVTLTWLNIFVFELLINIQTYLRRKVN